MYNGKMTRWMVVDHLRLLDSGEEKFQFQTKKERELLFVFQQAYLFVFDWLLPFEFSGYKGLLDDCIMYCKPH